MKQIFEWIRCNQITSFFILTFAITWPGFILIFFIYPGNQVIEVLFSQVVYSPAISSLLISRIAEPEPKHKRDKKRILVFLISWLIATAVQIIYFREIYNIDITRGIVIISSLFALLPALILSSAFSRTPGVRKQFSTLMKPGGPAIWYLVIFLIFPGIPIISMFITNITGGEAVFYLAERGFQGAAVFLILEFTRGFLMTGGINEESGWRGFALPRLQARYSVLASAAIVWFFWSLWHIPYDIGTGVPAGWIIENRIVWCFVFSIIMTWLYNRTNGSILAPALFHPAMNAFGNQFSLNPVNKILFLGLAAFAIFYDKMWKKLPEQKPDIADNRNHL